jgi:hypothetical protein
MSKLNPQQLEAAWAKGFLQWKLRPVQVSMYRAIDENDSLKYVINASRRIGKSFLLCLKAVEYAIANPKYPVRYAAPTQNALRKIIIPLMQEILSDCPIHLRPQWKVQEGVWKFPSGGEIHISGANGGRSENLRGTAAGLAIVDEAGFVDDLKYLVEDILMPQLLTTGGQVIISSTPPRTPAHDFVTYAQAAMQNGNYSEYTINQSGYDPKVISRFKEEAGGEEGTTWQREYLCKFIVDKDFAIVPEWKDEYIQPVQRDDYFHFYHLYEGMDLGVTDFTAVLFGYYDFRKAKVFIEDEVIMHGPKMTTQLLADAIKEKEKDLWPDLGQRNGMKNQERQVYRRIADNNNPLLLQDLGSLHQLHFWPTTKDNLDAMVNELRLYVSQGRILIDPKCRQAIGCLKYGAWDEKRKKFGRSAVYGHYDALAALIYLVRNLDVHTSPIPPDYNLSESTHWISLGYRKEHKNTEAIYKMLGINRFGRFRD